VVTLFHGKSLLESGALDAGHPWLPSIFVIASAVTAGAVLRVAGRVFLGWGPAERADTEQEAAAAEEQPEEPGAPGRTPPLMLAVPAVMLVLAIVVGLIPGAVDGIQTAAAHFTDHAGYIDWVLRGHVHFPPAEHSHVEAFDYYYGAGATVGAVLLAALGLFGRPLLRRIPEAASVPVRRAVGGLRVLHSGHIGDYTAWWTAGAALFGGASLIFLR
jgi:multicomponent Na+:H+ antiporter subunit D